MIFGLLALPQCLLVQQSTKSLDAAKLVQLTPEQEVEGHPLGPASVQLSPHKQWLASVGKDGQLRVREASCMV